MGGENHDKHSRVANVHPIPEKLKTASQVYRGAQVNKGINLLKLGEISPLGLSKLGLKLGSIELVFGLSNAVRMDSLKVYR